jgi:hypothetical protein
VLRLPQVCMSPLLICPIIVQSMMVITVMCTQAYDCFKRLLTHSESISEEEEQRLDVVTAFFAAFVRRSLVQSCDALPSVQGVLSSLPQHARARAAGLLHVQVGV